MPVGESPCRLQTPQSTSNGSVLFAFLVKMLADARRYCGKIFVSMSMKSIYKVKFERYRSRFRWELLDSITVLSAKALTGAICMQSTGQSR